MSGTQTRSAGQPGARLRPAQLRDVLLYVLTLALLLWLLLRGAELSGYNWQWRKLPGFLISWQDGRPAAGALLRGLGVTLALTPAALLAAGLIGLAAALLRLSASPVGRVLSRVYLELVRNTPLLVQLFCLYFVLAPILGLGRMCTAILAIDRGQWEACQVLGLNRWQSYRHVVLPQALRRMLPPLTSQAVSLVKDSALVSTIAVYELTMQGRALIAETLLSFEIWLLVAALYLGLTLFLSVAAAWLRRRLARSIC